MASPFKGSTRGCGGRGGCSSGRAGLASVFPIIFVLHLNDLPPEALSSTSLILSVKEFH